MKYRPSIFLVVFSKNKYLLLKRKLHWQGWEFPKGGIEKNENIIGAVRREVKEETGLKVKKIIDMKIKGRFDYGRELPDRPGFLGQKWKLYAVEVFPGKVKLDRIEHDNFKWLNFNSAYKLLTWESQKKCLRVVEKNLSSQPKC